MGPKIAPELQSDEINLTSVLTDHSLLLEEGHCLRDHTLYACGPSGEISSERLETTSLLTLVQMVESVLGIALVPEMAVRLPKGLAPERTIALVACRSAPRLAVVQTLVELIQSLHSSDTQCGAIEGKNTGMRSK